MYKKGQAMSLAREKIEDIITYPILEIQERGISKRTAEHFGIRTKLDESDGITPVAHYFPYTIDGTVVGYKKRNLTIPKSYKPKKGEEGHFSAVGSVSVDCELFGAVSGNSTGGKKVWITEGEYDCAIIWQTLKARYPKANPTVLSIGLGTANAVKHIGKKSNLRYLRKFSEIISAFDADRATPEEKEKNIKKGKDATNDLYGLIPELLYVDLPDDKDPVETFFEIGEEQLYWLCMKPIAYTPEGFIKFEDARTKAIELPTVGRGWPWPTVMKKTLGRRDGEGIYLGAGVKMGKCFRKGTSIRMYDGSCKPVQDIVKGDVVMGWDSSPRNVTSTHSGADQMYKIHQTAGCDYIVNSQHTLVLKNGEQLVERSVEDLYTSYGEGKPLGNLKGIHSIIDYPAKQLEVDPYTFGVWLGDGSRSDNRICLNKEDAKFILKKAQNITKFKSSKESCHEGVIEGYSQFFKSFNGKKRIPDNYLLSSIQQRRDLLSGVIDTDGHKYADNSWEVMIKDKQFAEDCYELIRSLGLRVSKNLVTKRIKSYGFEGKYYRLTFSGDLRGFNITVPRKMCNTAPKKDPSKTGVKIFKESVEGYYGFEVDGDHKFVLEDYTVVHNSEYANKLIEHIVKEEKDDFGNPRKVAVFKFEEQPDETIKKVAGKFYRKDFANPEKIIFIDEQGVEVDVWGNKIINKESFFTQEELIEAVDSVGPHLILYNNYGRCNWKELKGAIRHAVLVEHVKDIFIDPITRLTAGMSASEANTELETFSDEISKMSQDLGFTYYCFCHLKSPEKGPPHEFGGKVYSAQFRGSRAMMQACHYTMGLEGNKNPDLPEKERNTRYLVILDDRKHGRTARIPLFYDKDTGDFVEPPEGFLESPYETLTEFRSAYPNGYREVDYPQEDQDSIL